MSKISQESILFLIHFPATKAQPPICFDNRAAFSNGHKHENAVAKWAFFKQTQLQGNLQECCVEQSSITLVKSWTEMRKRSIRVRILMWFSFPLPFIEKKNLFPLHLCHSGLDYQLDAPWVGRMGHDKQTWRHTDEAGADRDILPVLCLKLEGTQGGLRWMAAWDTSVQPAFLCQ